MGKIIPSSFFCFLCIQVYFGSWETIILKRYNFDPQSLGAMLEYWYVQMSYLKNIYIKIKKGNKNVIKQKVYRVV